MFVGYKLKLYFCNRIKKQNNNVESLARIFLLLLLLLCKHLRSGKLRVKFNSRIGQDTTPLHMM